MYHEKDAVRLWEDWTAKLKINGHSERLWSEGITIRYLSHRLFLLQWHNKVWSW